MFRNDYVLNIHDGRTYRIATNTIQTRNRRQVKGTAIKKISHSQVAQNHLRKLTENEAKICMAAEKIIRCKKSKTNFEKAIIESYKNLKQKVIG